MKLSDQQYIFAVNFADLIIYCDTLVDDRVLTKFALGEGWRQKDWQKILRERGSSHVKHSLHEDKLAHDMYFWINGKFVFNERKNVPLIEEIGWYWEKLHDMNKWGGHYKSFVDLCHFEMRRIK